MQDVHMQGEWERLISGIVHDAKFFTNTQILENFKRASTLMQRDNGMDFWTSDECQSELLRRIQAESKPPPTAPRRWGSSMVGGTANPGVASALDLPLPAPGPASSAPLTP